MPEAKYNKTRKAKYPGIMLALGNGQENVSKCPLMYKGFFCNFGVWKFCKGHLQKCMPSLVYREISISIRTITPHTTINNQL